MNTKKKVLFICTHNAARSQMAEGYMNAKYGDRYEAFSGGDERNWDRYLRAPVETHR
jgi:protein-tyrosine-phosphatase